MAKAAKIFLKGKSKIDIEEKYINIWKALFTKFNKK